MKQVILSIAILISFAGFGQNRTVTTLYGKITDAGTKLPLPGANIHLTDARIGTTADSNGVYIIKNLPAGHHLLEVSHTAYKTIVQHIDIAGNTEQNFTLTTAIIENQGVTVTGVISATSTRKTPVPVTLVRRADLLQTPSTNIIDALSKQPGIAQISTGPAISKPVIRGLGYNRVVVINDGTRQEGQQWGDEHGIEIDELSVVRAEIVKGPASLIYGSDALAGVIHFITNVPAPEGTIKGNLYSNYQTNNGLRGLNANVAGNQNGFNWNVYGSSKSAKDYRNKFDGRVLNSRFNEKNYGGYIGLNKSWGYAHIVASSFNQNLGLVEGERDENTGEFLVATAAGERPATREELDSRELFIPNQNVQHYKVMSDNSFNIGKSRLKLNVGFQNNLRKEFGNPEDLTETELFFDLKTTNYNLQWRIPEGKGFQTTVGFSGMNQVNENRGSEVIIPEYNLSDLGGFVFVEKTLSKATISGGLRYDNRTIDSKAFSEGGDAKFSAFKKNFSNISGSAGISYQPNEVVVIKANVARGFRAPTLSELAANGAHEGTNRYEYGQPNLVSERSLQFDAGADADYEHVSFSISAFHNRLKDFIFYSRLSSVNGGDSLVTVDGEELEGFQYNQHNAKLKGLEASMDIHPHPLDWLHFKNTLSLLRGKFDAALDASNNLPMIPAGRLISQLRTNVAKNSKAFRNMYLLVEMDKTFAQNNPFLGFNTETKTPGYTLFNAGFGVDISSKSVTRASLHFSGNNLTDEAYQTHLSRLKYTAENVTTGRRGVFNMGRNFSIKLSVPFSFRTDSKKTEAAQ